MKLKAHRIAVIKNNMGEEVEVKNGRPLDSSVKTSQTPNTVGVSVGITKNMGNYESMRVDVWAVDNVRKGETKEKAIRRVSKELAVVLTDTVNELK